MRKTMNTNRFHNLLVLALILAGTYPLLSLEPGEKAPPFVNPDLEMQHVQSRDFLGKGWVIINFFATDCEGCKKELPILERLSHDFADQGLIVLIFATDPEGQEVVVPYFQCQPTALAVLLDRYRVALNKYGVKEIPSLFLVDPDGTVVYKVVGFQEDLYGQINQLISPDEQQMIPLKARVGEKLRPTMELP